MMIYRRITGQNEPKEFTKEQMRTFRSLKSKSYISTITFVVQPSNLKLVLGILEK